MKGLSRNVMDKLLKYLQQGKQETRQERIGIKGCGYSVPPHIRGNNDPLFLQITKEKNAQGIAEVDLFTGMKERRYLQGDEQIEPLMVEASQLALQRANVTPEDIDELYGYVSVPDFYTPNGLYKVHKDLKLPEQTLVVALNNDLARFLLGFSWPLEPLPPDRASMRWYLAGLTGQSI